MEIVSIFIHYLVDSPLLKPFFLSQRWIKYWLKDEWIYSLFCFYQHFIIIYWFFVFVFYLKRFLAKGNLASSQWTARYWFSCFLTISSSGLWTVTGKVLRGFFKSGFLVHGTVHWAYPFHSYSLFGFWNFLQGFWVNNCCLMNQMIFATKRQARLGIIFRILQPAQRQECGSNSWL